MPPPIVNGLVGFTRVVLQTFTSSGTYTPTAGMVQAFIECQGPGGGGGGAIASTAGTQNCSGGGGAGEYAGAWVTAAQVGASQVVTVGTGGAGGTAGNNAGTAGSANTSVGTLCVGVFGGGGGGAAAGAGGTAGVGGGGGTGAIRHTGGTGSVGFTYGTVLFLANGVPGGNSHLGNGGIAAPISVTGLGATGKGGGGAGAGSFNNGAAVAGGPGTDGFVSITEYVR